MSAPSNAVQYNGQGVVSADQYNTYAQWCPNVATLRLFAGLTSMEVELQGYVSQGDGGQGRFVWTVGTGTDDGGVTTVVPTGNTSGYWARIPNYAAVVSPQTVTSSGNVTLTAANVTNRSLVRTGGADTTDTLPSAASIVSALSGYQPGSQVNLLVVNTNSGNLTLAPGAGVTLTGNLAGGDFVLPTATQRDFVLWLQNAGAVTIVG